MRDVFFIIFTKIGSPDTLSLLLNKIIKLFLLSHVFNLLSYNI